MEENNYIGERLKQARIEKGYTLDDLQQLTKIQKRYLIAIEENHLDKLPSPFFVKAFIRQYAEVVEVSLEELPTEEGESAEFTQPTHYTDKLPNRADLKRSSKDTNFEYGDSSRSSFSTFLVVLLFIVVLGLIWSYFFFFRNDPEDLINSDSSSQPQISEVITDSSSQADSSIVEIEEPIFTAGESVDAVVPVTLHQFTLPTTLMLNVDNTGASWMQVTVNDAVIFEATIPAGSSQEVEIAEGAEEIRVRVGYLPSTTIVFGEDLTIPNPDNSQTIQTQTFIFEIE